MPNHNTDQPSTTRAPRREERVGAFLAVSARYFGVRRRPGHTHTPHWTGALGTDERKNQGTRGRTEASRPGR